MIKTLKSYLAESTSDGTFMIKMVMKPKDDHIKIIKKVLSKFGCSDMSSPEQLENDHYDFIDVPNADVWQIVANLETPASPYFLHQELRQALNINDKLLIVRASQEPVEIYSEIQRKSNDTVRAARLSTSRTYEEDENSPVDPAYGDEYNKGLLNYLATVAATRRSMDIEPSDPLFSWLDMSKVKANDLDSKLDMSDFNDGIDTPKPVYKADKKIKLPANAKFMNRYGGFENSSIANPAVNPNASTTGRKKPKS